MMRGLWAPALAALAGLVAFSFWQIPVVTLRLPEKDDRIAWVAAAREGERVVFRYRHSVEQTWVEGVFEVRASPEPPRLVLVQTRYASAGSGLPTEDTARTRREADAWIVDADGTAACLIFRTHDVNAAELRAGEQRFALQSLPSGTLIRLSAEQLPRWRWWLLRALSPL